MSALPEIRQPITEAEYLAFERAAQTKHELLDGEVFAMSGASEAHNLISMNTGAALHTQLRGRSCKVYPSDMRVKTPDSLYTYPDLSVVCGDSKFSDEEFDTLLNPTVLIEVLSPSTERYDRGRKFQAYRGIPTLREYLLIAQDSPHIEHYTRQPDDRWVLTEAVGMGATLSLAAIGCTLALTDVYEQVTFRNTPDDTPQHE